MGKTTKMKNMTKKIINKIFTPYPVTGYGVKIYIYRELSYRTVQPQHPRNSVQTP